MDKNKLQKYTYIDEKTKKIDIVFQSIDCVEQAEYFSAIDADIDMCYVFINDINIKYVINQEKNEHYVVRNNIEQYNCFVIEKIENSKPYFEVIKKHIDRGDNVTFQTMFDLLYPYCWYSEDDLGNHKKIILLLFWTK